MTSRHPRGLVVGVDGTDGGSAALSFAMREAARRGSPLEVITVWTQPAEGPSDMADEGSAGGSSERTRRRAQHVQDRAVALTLQQVDARPTLTRQVVEGDVGQVLLRLARHADYLVVGGAAYDPSRPTSQGRVRDFCIRHANCAVVLVPPWDSAIEVPGLERSRR